MTLLLAIVFSTNLNAQSNKGDLLKLDLGILNKIRLTYEHPLSTTFTTGASGDFYYGTFPGFKLEPFARFYMGGEAPDGLYLQARFLYGSFNKDFIYYATGVGNPNSNYYLETLYQKKSVSSMGGGLDLGYQWLSGRNKNIVVDLSLGTQFMNDINHTIVQNGVEYSTENVGFLTTGPGGVFNPHLSIGYRF
ncbi:MAG: hypothetical protein RLZ56_469 [Bacteroidota bacterium]